MPLIYGKARVVDQTAGLSREEWLQRRSLGIGASEIAAVLGVDEYAGPWTVAARKLGVVGESTETTATRYGHALEPLVLSMTGEELQVQVEPVKVTLSPPDRSSPIRVSLDGWVDAEQRSVEAKAPFRRMDHAAWQALREDGVPADGSPLESYWWQKQCQLHATCVEAGYLSGLVGGSLYVCRIEADPFAAEQLEDEARKLWAKIEAIRADPGMMTAFLNGAIIAPNAADRGEWQRKAAAPPSKRIVEVADMGLDEAIAQLRIAQAKHDEIGRLVEALSVRVQSAALSAEATTLLTPNYEAVLHLTHRTTSEYGAEAPKEALARLAQLRSEQEELKRRLKPFANVSQSIRLDAFPRRSR